MPDSLTHPALKRKTLVINRTSLPVHLQAHNINSEDDNGLVSRTLNIPDCKMCWVLMDNSWIGPVWPLLEIFGDSTADDNEVIDGFVGPIIKDGLAKRAAYQKAGVKIEQDAKEYSLLSSLLTQTDNYKVLRDETFNVLLAGQSSLSEYSLYWIADIHHTIARNPVSPLTEQIHRLSYAFFSGSIPVDICLLLLLPVSASHDKTSPGDNRENWTLETTYIV